MKFKTISICMFFVLSSMGFGAMISSCGSRKGNSESSEKKENAADSIKSGSPALGEKGSGPAIDKSGDAELQKLIKEVAPKFSQLEFKDKETGKTMVYNLYSPEGSDKSTYPIVMFMADASTPGGSVTLPLTQGYGGLIWAADDSQKKNPCYVLVPQFSGVVVNDEYQHTEEADIAMRLLESVAESNKVDKSRMYATGQSMGGMIAMYYNVAYPGVFAASMFVDSHWNPSDLDELAKHKFIWFISGDTSKAFSELNQMEEAARKDGVEYTWSSWSAQLPEKRQSELAETMLQKGAPVNIFQFEPKSVLPAEGKGSEHVYSFDCAYKVTSARDWLFRQKK